MCGNVFLIKRNEMKTMQTDTQIIKLSVQIVNKNVEYADKNMQYGVNGKENRSS